MKTLVSSTLTVRIMRNKTKKEDAWTKGGCMGPKVGARKVTSTYNEVLTLLREKGLVTFEKPHPIKPMQSARERCLQQLKDAIEEVLFQEACERF